MSYPVLFPHADEAEEVQDVGSGSEDLDTDLEELFFTLATLQEEIQLNLHIAANAEENGGYELQHTIPSVQELVSDIEEAYLLQLDYFVQRTMPLNNGDQMSLPIFVYPNVNDIRNVTFSNNSGLQPTQASLVLTRTPYSSSHYKYVRMFLTLLKAHELITSNQKATKREIYYQNVEAYGNQRNLDCCIVAVSAMLRVPRSSLNIVATSKGLVGGNICYLSNDGVVVDCLDSKSGEPIPEDPNLIVELRTTARMILVIEKDATFQRLLQDDFFLSNAVLMTAKGMPDFSSRAFLKRLSNDLPLPIFGLFDADPYGIEIMLVYKFGSKISAWCSETVAVPRLQWLGVHPDDLKHLDPSLLIELSGNDIAKIRSLLNREYLLTWGDFRQQLDILGQSGHKAEIENVAFLKLYLSQKIINRQWI